MPIGDLSICSNPVNARGDFVSEPGILDRLWSETSNYFWTRQELPFPPQSQPVDLHLHPRQWSYRNAPVAQAGAR